MKNEYTHYLNAQKNFRDKWNEYYALPENFKKSHIVPELTPFFGMVEYQTLNELEKERLFLEYLKLVSEALVFFEQLLVLGAWDLLKKKNDVDASTKQALKQFAFEELYHSNGFRHFLHLHKNFNWDQCKIYADSKILRKLITSVVHFSPACVFLPGAKLEAFTLSYYRMIKKYYPDYKSNSWIHLNYIHQVDEAHHLPLEFDLHDAVIEKVGVIKTIVGSVLFVIVMQIALVVGSFKVINFSLKNKSFFSKINFTLKMARWAVRITPAYNEAREITKKQFKNKKPKFGQWWSFIYW